MSVLLQAPPPTHNFLIETCGRTYAASLFLPIYKFFKIMPILVYLTTPFYTHIGIRKLHLNITESW